MLSHEANNGLTIRQGRLSEEGSRHWADIRHNILITLKSGVKTINKELMEEEEFQFANLEPK